MNTIFRKPALLTFCILLLCTACRKYQVISDTKDINTVFIGLQPSYTAHLGSNYQIDPALTFTQDKSSDTARYKYQWYILNTGLCDCDPNYKVILDSTRNLISKVTLSPGAYVLVYIVTDTITGVSWQQSTSLTVSTPYYQGWLVLSDAGAAPRLDMVSYNDSGVGVLYFDVLGLLGSGLKLTGQAKNVEFSGNIYITTTGNGTNWVDPENFSWKPTNNIRYKVLDNTIPSNFYADPFITSPIQGIYGNGDVYLAYNGVFALPLNYMKGEAGKFYASPFFTTNYLYDQNKKRFGYASFAATSCTPLPVYGTSGATLFDFNNTGMSLLYMASSTYNGNTVFAVLQDSTGTDHLAIIDNAGKSQDYYATMSGPNLSSATSFAVNNAYGYVFYSTGSKLYEFDLGVKTSKLMIDYGALQITNIYTNPIQSQPSDLLVTLADQSGTSGSNGTLNLYTVAPVGGSLVLNETYTGFGKIKDIAYRTR